jgi:hypothetical protein
MYDLRFMICKNLAQDVHLALGYMPSTNINQRRAKPCRDAAHLTGQKGWRDAERNGINKSGAAGAEV